MGTGDRGWGPFSGRGEGGIHAGNGDAWPISGLMDVSREVERRPAAGRDRQPGAVGAVRLAGSEASIAPIWRFHRLG